MLCREYALVKVFDGGYYAAPLCCRSWTCAYCRPARKREVMRAAAVGFPDTFITLTVNPNDGTYAVYRAEQLVKAWRKFVKFAKKYYGYPTIPYFAVFEATKKGEPHLHILCRVKWIDYKLLSQFMKAEINAPIVDIRRCWDARSAARYVGKYLGKKPAKFGTCKRYWQTRDYKKQDPEDNERKTRKSEGWFLHETPIAVVIWRARDHGFTVTREGDIWKVLERAPP